MTGRVEVSIDNGIARVELNRADKRNALDMAMFRGIHGAQKQLRKDRDVRAVILSGRGEDFCSGLDIRSVMSSPGAALRLLGKWLPWRPNLAQAVSVGWRRLPVPVIAVLHGRCWGGGLQVALGADFRYAHDQASLSVMEGRWGLIPDMGGTLCMRDVMPRDQAMRLAMSAQTIGATEALELGLVTRVSADPSAEAMEFCLQLLNRSPDAVAAVKRLYRRSWRRGYWTLARESLYQSRILAGANQRIAAQRQRGEDLPWKRPKRW